MKEANNRDNAFLSANKPHQTSPFFQPVIQPKLTVNEPGDVYEREADAVADKVMRMTGMDSVSPTFFSPVQTPVQRKCAHCEEEERTLVQRKESNTEATGVNDSLAAYVGNLSGKGQPLPAETQTFFAQRMGHDFSAVRVHTNNEASASAQAINAVAYTTGNNLVFNQGQYSPHTQSGKYLLAHELAHVVQQENSNSVTIQRTKSVAHSCPDQYETGEEEKSHSEKGILQDDVFVTGTKNLVIADFGISERHPKHSIKMNYTLQSWMKKFESEEYDDFKIYGYSDCVGEEVDNDYLRKSRAKFTTSYFGPRAKKKIKFSEAAPAGEYLEANSTKEGRAMNRSVVVHFFDKIIPNAHPFSPDRGHEIYDKKEAEDYKKKDLCPPVTEEGGVSEVLSFIEEIKHGLGPKVSDYKFMPYAGGYKVYGTAHFEQKTRVCDDAFSHPQCETISTMAAQEVELYFIDPSLCLVQTPVQLQSAEGIVSPEDPIGTAIMIVGGIRVLWQLGKAAITIIAARRAASKLATSELSEGLLTAEAQLPKGTLAAEKTLALPSKPDAALLPNGRPIPPNSYSGGYHGTTEQPSTVLKSGLPGKGNNWSLLEHAEGNSGSAFRGTTRLPADAAKWAGEGKYVYEVEGVPTWDVNKALQGRVPKPEGGFGDGPWVGENEFAIPAEVSPDKIVRWGIVKLNSTNKEFVEWMWKRL